MWYCGFWDMRADRQTDRQTDMLIAIVRWSNKCWKQASNKRLTRLQKWAESTQQWDCFTCIDAAFLIISNCISLEEVATDTPSSMSLLWKWPIYWSYSYIGSIGTTDATCNTSSICQKITATVATKVDPCTHRHKAAKHPNPQIDCFLMQ